MAETHARNDAADDLDQLARQPVRVLSWWIILTGLAALVAAAVVILEWFAPIAGKSPSLRIQVIQVALNVVAGSGGATILLLALRRQRLLERAQFHAEVVARAVHLHAEQVAKWGNAEAIERRVTDVYSRAVEQIGHSNPTVRLGGLYSLERLAEANLLYRQTVADLLCAYLRMPYRSDQIDREELQVRLTAQRMLVRHLAHRAADGEDAATEQALKAYWGPLRIGLNGASLHDFDFSGCGPGDSDLRNAEFFGSTLFEGKKFTGQAQFGGSAFRGDHVSFSAATFEQEAQFSETEVLSNAKFNDAQFACDVAFDDAQFHGKAEFTKVEFGGITRFDDAEFHSNCWMDGASFGAAVRFSGTTFAQGCDFDGASFAYREPHCSWPVGWHLEPLTGIATRLVPDKPAIVGIARYHGPGTPRISAHGQSRDLPA